MGGGEPWWVAGTQFSTDHGEHGGSKGPGYVNVPSKVKEAANS